MLDSGKAIFCLLGILIVNEKKLTALFCFNWHLMSIIHDTLRNLFNGLIYNIKIKILCGV